MGKAAMCIRMLQILNTGRVYKISELASILDTNPRNIIEYKKELDEVARDYGYGFFIEKICGRYGGYKLNGNIVIPAIKFVPEEKEAFFEGLNYLMARNDFMMKDEYIAACSKILSSLIINDIKRDKDMLVINRFPLAMSEEDLKARLDIVKSAISKKRKIKFQYLSQKNIVKEHILDPYEVFMYNNAWFVIGWLNSVDHSDICWFKLNRIQEIEMTSDRFTVWKYYNKHDYVDEFGFKTNGDWYHIEFIAHGTYASLCKERIYGKNQVVETLNDNSTKVSVDMQNQENIRVFVLGFGKNITVLEPQWLKDDLVEIANSIKEKYGA